MACDGDGVGGVWGRGCRAHSDGAGNACQPKVQSKWKEYDDALCRKPEEGPCGPLAPRRQDKRLSTFIGMVIMT